MKPDSTAHHANVLIVGAGMAGLVAATVLSKHNVELVVADKAKSVGGRLATRRIGAGKADHGAQFFTVRSLEFGLWVEKWLAEGLVFRWSSGWSDGSLAKTEADGYPRYAVNGGMNALAKHLAIGLNTRLNFRVVAISPTHTGWQVVSESGDTLSARAIILTPPVPQALHLLNAGHTPLAQMDRIALERIAYAPCLAGLYWIDGSIDLPEPGALQRHGNFISWIADNQRKGISPEATLLTVHTGTVYSQELWSQPDGVVLQTITAELKPFLGEAAKIVEAQLKRWRYALPTKLHSDRCLSAAHLPPLIFAGDAFGEPRVEGAALSGMAAANKLLAILTHNK